MLSTYPKATTSKQPILQRLWASLSPKMTDGEEHIFISPSPKSNMVFDIKKKCPVCVYE